MKKCQYAGCNNEIQTWQQYCPEHYRIVMQQGQGQTDVPTIPQSRIANVQAQKNMPTPTNPTATFQQKDDLPSFEIQERDRLIIKQTCLKGAVDIMCSAEWVEPPKDFDELAGQIETLTLKFFKIITSHNENKTL